VTRPLGENGLIRQMYLASRRDDTSAASQSLYQLLRRYAPQ
jgi:LysR family transcriptional regulator, regulator for metE and metH